MDRQGQMYISLSKEWGYKNAQVNVSTIYINVHVDLHKCTCRSWLNQDINKLDGKYGKDKTNTVLVFEIFSPMFYYFHKCCHKIKKKLNKKMLVFKLIKVENLNETLKN